MQTKPFLPILILFGLALLIRVSFVFTFSFDGLYGQDAFAYFDQAASLAEALPRGHLPPLDFFWPNGYPFLAAVFMGLMGKTETAALLPVLLTGAALAPLAYLLCLEFFGEHGPRAGWLAGLIFAVAGQPIQSSVTSMADIPGLFWAMLAVWCLARVWKGAEVPTVPPNSPPFPELIGTYKGTHRNLQGSLWSLTLAGLFLALATVTRWNYAMLALPFAVFTLDQTRKHRTPIWRLAFPGFVGFAILLVQVWVSSHRPEGMFHQWLVGWHPRNFFGSAFQTPDGVQTFERPVWFFNLLPSLHPAYLFPLFGVAIPFGVWHLWREENRGALILLGGWFSLTYAFLAGIPYENFRFGLALYPPLVLCAAYGLTHIEAYAIRNTEYPLHARIKLGYQIITAGSLLFMLFWATRMVGSFLETHTAAKQQVLEIAAQLPSDATLLTLGPTLIFAHYTPIHAVEIYSTSQEALPELIAEASSFYVLLNLPNLASQWKGLAPEQNFHWLKTHAQLQTVGEYLPYTLFKVQNLLP